MDSGYILKTEPTDFLTEYGDDRKKERRKGQFLSPRFLAEQLVLLSTETEKRALGEKMRSSNKQLDVANESYNLLYSVTFKVGRISSFF